MKTALATATASRKTLDDILLSLRSTPIGPNLPSPREILHNHMEKRPRQTPHAVDYEEITNYLLDKKTQKRYHDQGHNVKPLPELKPGQKILFMSPKDENQYIEGTVTSKASTPRSYYLECQGKQYCHTQQHIHAIDITTLQDHQQPFSQDHHSNKQPVSQDNQSNKHQNNKQLVSQDHQSTKQPALQDHQHTTKNNTLQDYQPKHRHRKVPSNRSTSMTEIQSSTVDQLLPHCYKWPWQHTNTKCKT